MDLIASITPPRNNAVTRDNQQPDRQSTKGTIMRKVQDKISKIDGVNSVSINAMTMKFTLDAADDKFDSIVKESVKVFNDVEPDCEVLV